VRPQHFTPSERTSILHLVPPKRRLPILPSSSRGSGDGEEARPPWQWIGFGTAAIFGAWLPLAYIGEGLKARIVRSYVGSALSLEETRSSLAALSSRDRTALTALTVLVYVCPFVVGAYVGGFLVGKWGESAGVREAALAGVSTAVIASALSWASTGVSWAPLIALCLATPASAFGAYAGIRRRT
jgi:hypothetical protein